MKIPFFQVDAFTDSIFSGNSAAVCLLKEWPKDSVLQDIASENNLSETAFIVEKHIRWFTPSMEVDLCGHATLAAATVLFYLDLSKKKITFTSKSGLLNVIQDKDFISLDFPMDNPQNHNKTYKISQNGNLECLNVLKGKDDFLFILQNHEAVENFVPDMEAIAKLNSRGVIISARGEDCDFVSRFFGPNCGVPEDPVTGSAHTLLAPYWAKILNKQSMQAKQLSQRGGTLQCKINGERVIISGKSRIVIEGNFYLEQ